MKRAVIFSEASLYYVYNPDYTASNQLGSLVSPSPISFRIEQATAEPNIPGFGFSYIYGDMTYLKTGYVLVPTAQGDQDGLQPITISRVPNTTMIPYGFITDRIGYICEDPATPLYTNVRFSFTFPFINEGEIRLIDANPQTKRKVLMYNRQGIGLNPQIIKGMRLVESDNDKTYIWKITDIMSISGKYTVMGIEEDV